MTSLVRRRDPPLIVLLDAGLLIGGAYYGLVSGKDGWLHEEESAAIAYGIWLTEAAFVSLAAAIQPGERAPLDIYRLALHGALAAVWSLFALSLAPGFAAYGVLPFLFALCAARDTERSRAAWRTGAGLLAAHLATLCGYLVARALWDRTALVALLSLLSLAIFPAAALQTSKGPARDARASAAYLVLLVLLGGGVGLPIEENKSAVRALAVELLRGPLPFCPGMPAHLYDNEEREILWSTDVPVHVAAADDDLSRDLSRPHDLLCSQLGALRYGTTPSVRVVGDGVAMRRIGGVVQLADGSPVSLDAVQRAALACGIPDRRLVPDPRDSWPAAVIVERCREPWLCVAPGRVCDYDPARGFFLRE